MNARPLLAGLLAALFASAPVTAEQVRQEVVGAVPIVEGSVEVPRDAAVEAAVAAAVVGVAQDLLPPDFAPPLTDANDVMNLEEWLAAQLGDPFLHALRFGIVEDRGPSPAMFSSDPRVRTEYVVVADVTVDADSVRQRLEGLGLLAASTPERGRRYLLELEGLDHYRPLELVREALEEDRAVRSVLPVEFERGRAVLAVEAGRDLQSLVSALQDRLAEGLQVVPLRVGADRASLLVDWTPPPARASEPADLSGD